MKFAIAKEHRDFFQRKGWIEFEDFFPSTQIELLNQAIDQGLSARLSIPCDRLSHQTSNTLFSQGRDLWRANEAVRNFTLQPKLAEIASELIEKKPLRLGYDQFFPAIHQSKFSNSNHQTYHNFIDQTATLEALSSIQGLVCGLIVPLGGKQDMPNENAPSTEGIDIFSGKPGHALFFQPGAEINWNHLHTHPSQRYYLIVYAQLTSFYNLQPKDPFTHFLKQLGYVFTDKLNDKWNPIVYR